MQGEFKNSLRDPRDGKILNFYNTISIDLE